MEVHKNAVRGCIALASSIVIALPLAAGSVPKAVAQDEAMHGIMKCPRGVVITELNNGGPGGYHDNFIEIASWSDSPVDVTGWQPFRCIGTGPVASARQNTLHGTIGAGETWVFARESSQSTISDADVKLQDVACQRVLRRAAAR